MIKQLFNHHPILAKLTMTLVGMVFLGGLIFVPPVAAQSSENSACGGIGIISGGNGTSSGCSSGNIDGIIADILNIISLIAGFIAVVMIIVGGFRYVVSGGNDQAVAGAKNTILYALIGVVVLILAQAIVHFVLGQSGL
jgi:hypothetical protein